MRVAPRSSRRREHRTPSASAPRRKSATVGRPRADNLDPDPRVLRGPRERPGGIFALRCALRDRDESGLDPFARDESKRPLTKAEYDTLATLALFVDADALECEVGARRPGRVMVRDQLTVRGAVHSLKAKGWLVLKDRPGRPWRIRLTVPESIDPGWETRSDPGVTPGCQHRPGRGTRRVRASRPDTPGVAPDEEVRDGTTAATVACPQSRRFSALLAHLNGAEPRGAQRELLLRAYLDAPEGFSQVAVQAQKGDSPLGLLTSLVRHDAHKEMQKKRERKSTPRPRCPDCGVAEGEGHAEDCSLAGVPA